MTTTPPPKLVKLIQCAKQRCGHVLTEDERVDVPHKDWANATTSTCPKCGNDSFYTLNEAGQKITTSQRDEYRDGIDPTTIQPSPRMGLKMRRRIFAAKNRALVQTAT